MAKKKKAPAKPESQKEAVGVLFDSWFKASGAEEQQIVNDVEKHLIGIQTDKKNLRKEQQPLRIGMELSKVRKLIIGDDGDADPQTKEGRIWGDYKDSHLKDAGYSRATCTRYVSMTVAARRILPDDLIVALLDYTNPETEMVYLTGGDVKKPFGKYTKFLNSSEVQNHLKDGKLDKFLSQQELLLSTFTDPDNVETPETLDNISVAINTAVKRIFAKVKEKEKLKAPFDAKLVVEKARDYVRDVIECLLLVCKCEDMTDLEAREDDGVIEKGGLDTLIGVVNKLNEEKQKATKPTKKQRAKKGIPQKPERTVGNALDVLDAVKAQQAGAASDKAPTHTEDDLKKMQEDAIRKGQHGHAG